MIRNDCNKKLPKESDIKKEIILSLNMILYLKKTPDVWNRDTQKKTSRSSKIYHLSNKSHINNMPHINHTFVTHKELLLLLVH